MDDSYVNGLTALAGGGQTGATQLLPRNMNRVTTVATSGDSCVLPAAAAGLRLYVTNAGANSMNVFPAGSTDVINALSAATAIAVASGATTIFFCAVNGVWNTK